MRRITAYGLFIAAWMSQLLGPTLALNDTINVTVGTGTTKTANLIAFGGGNVISEVGICDATTANQCAIVSAAGAVKVDGSGVTQPISAVSLPLPAGAATLAGLTTINATLGSPLQAGGMIGNTSFGAVLNAETTKVIGTVRNLGNAGAVTDFTGQNASSPANAWLIGGQFNTSPTTLISGNASPFQLDNAGNLKINVVAGGAGGGAVTVANGADTAEGSTTDNPATCTLPTSAAACTVVQLLKQLLNTSSFPSNIGATDCSGTATGTAANAFTASATKHAFFIANDSTTDAIKISFTGTAPTASYILAPGTASSMGGSFSAPPGFGFSGNLSVISLGTSSAYTCTYY